MNAHRSLPGTLFLSAALAATAPSCASTVSQQLPLQGLQAQSTFPRLVTCAQVRGLQAERHADAVEVRYDANILLRFAIRGEQYNLVMAVDSGIPDDERPGRTAAARSMGEELFTCSAQTGAIVAPAGTGDAVGIPPEGAVACVGAVAPLCRQDGECQSQNCTTGVCQNRTPGSPCGISDGHCDSMNCTDGCCQGRTVGSPCGSSDGHCDSLNCTHGRCEGRTVGSPCGGVDAHCDSLNCTDGRCQGRTTGSACGHNDAHCDSLRCTGGFCAPGETG